jgi:hypothetical protein
MAAVHNQITSFVQFRNLAITSNNSASVLMGGSGAANDFSGVTFLVNFSGTSASAFKIQQSADNSTWTDLAVGYQTSSTFGAPITVAPANPAGNITVSATPSAGGQFLAISVNRHGRETSPANLTVPLTPATPVYLRANVTTNGANATYCVAALYNGVFMPVAQPDIAAETKGTN